MRRRSGCGVGEAATCTDHRSRRGLEAHAAVFVGLLPGLVSIHGSCRRWPRRRQRRFGRRHESELLPSVVFPDIGCDGHSSTNCAVLTAACDDDRTQGPHPTSRVVSLSGGGQPLPAPGAAAASAAMATGLAMKAGVAWLVVR